MYINGGWPPYDWEPFNEGLSTANINSISNPYFDEYIVNVYVATDAGAFQKELIIEGIDEKNTTADMLNISPNPARRHVVLNINLQSIEQLSLSIYQLSGQLIRKFDQSDFKIGQNQIQVELDMGYYLAILKTNNNIYTEKFIIIK